MLKLTVGSNIPEFQLHDQEENLFTISDVIGKKNLIIYFYPKDETVTCTKEACSFRDAYEVFKEHDAEVIGISSDTTESHKAFSQHHQLPFILLSDPGNKVRNIFGVPKNIFGLLPGRVTYIIDKQGIIQHIFNSQMDAQKHVDIALDILKRL